jgi:hypothetical protein
VRKTSKDHVEPEHPAKKRNWRNAGASPVTARRKSPKRQESFAAGVGRGIRRAARIAREVARRYGTPIYVWENGKVVAKDPNDDAK